MTDIVTVVGSRLEQSEQSAFFDNLHEIARKIVFLGMRWEWRGGSIVAARTAPTTQFPELDRIADGAANANLAASGQQFQPFTGLSHGNSTLIESFPCLDTI